MEKFTKWDLANILTDDETISEYLSIVLKENDPILLLSTLNEIARIKGMAKMASKAKVSRTSLYKSLTKNSDPRISTILKILKAMNIELSAKIKAA